MTERLVVCSILFAGLFSCTDTGNKQPFDPLHYVDPFICTEGDNGQSVYLIGSPIFPELTLHLDNGNVFKIVANNVSEENFYIRSAKLNGQEFSQSWIAYTTLMEGGILEFEMAAQPNPKWGK
ncbi:MAG: glycoside hydrolase domain-containing protein [Prolixibacteraceae bacterium]